VSSTSYSCQTLTWFVSISLTNHQNPKFRDHSSGWVIGQSLSKPQLTSLTSHCLRWEPGNCTPVPTHSVAGGRGGEGRKGGLVRRMIAEVNVRKVGTIRRRRCAESMPLANEWTAVSTTRTSSRRRQMDNGIMSCRLNYTCVLGVSDKYIYMCITLLTLYIIFIAIFNT